jgi:2-haloacid dehalogenase
VLAVILKSAIGLVIGGVVVVSAAVGQRQSATVNRPYAAVALDYLVIFNPDSVITVADRILPGRGRALTELWRIRQFEYTWLRSLTGRYADFSVVTRDALTYAADAMGVSLTPLQRDDLLGAYLHLTPWPDASDGLRRLRAAGVRVIVLADFSPAMLRANAERAQLMPLFDDLVSTDANQTFKPDPRAYQLGIDHLGLVKQDVVFAAFGGWDAAGAKSFGYPTVWVNRFHVPDEQLGVRPDVTVPDMSGLVKFVLGRSGRQR